MKGRSGRAEARPVLISESMGIISGGSHGSYGALEQHTLGVSKALALVLDNSTNTDGDGDRWVGPVRRSRPQRNVQALGPPKKKHHQVFGALAAHMGEEQSLASSTLDST